MGGEVRPEEVEAIIHRLYESPRFQRLMKRMAENPEPIKVCSMCWFELRSSKEVETHKCPPEPAPPVPKEPT